MTGRKRDAIQRFNYINMGPIRTKAVIIISNIISYLEQFDGNSWAQQDQIHSSKGKSYQPKRVWRRQ
jgi:enoyl-[acyl-carrier-protein] reductase (NADH)